MTRVYTTQKQQRVCTAIDLDLNEKRARFKTPDGESHRVSARNIIWITRAKKLVRICYAVPVDVSGSAVKSVKKTKFLHEAKLDDGSVMLFNPRFHRVVDD